ncbi:hypothetical protein [Peribacillus loiseleuriae]|uniref:Uncharacterized protein n=1 Tax=Peribacillus loiseleuriae TaxID=1679170 RepID=A0A0K9GSK7_9BACI|nr:hypothetical protein [Peribacillus loiseleuriae]KMY49615.1 hypothetical protein AC625_08725 [Peribacillus loiseleuriae]
MDVYAQVKIDLVLFNGGSIEEAGISLHDDIIKDTKVIITTTNGREIIFDSKKSEINNVEVSWEAEYDDEVC